MKFLEFTGEVTPISVRTLLAQLQRSAGQKTVLIDSPGGDLLALSALTDTLAQARYASVAHNRVSSAAIMLYVLGNRRLAFPDATFAFHLGSVGYNDEEMTTVEQLQVQAAIEREWARQNGHSVRYTNKQTLLREDWARHDWSLSLLAARTGRDRSTFLNLKKQAVTLTAAQALQYGLVEKIVDPEELIDD